MINRRRFLFAGAGIVGVLGVGVWGLTRPVLEAEIASMLHRRLAPIQLDREGVRVFAREQASAITSKRIPTWNRLRYHFLSAVSPSFKRYAKSTDTRTRLTRAEDKIIAVYLLSSDFFLNSADETRVVKYVAFYDPLIGCGNPFARPASDV